MRRVLAMSVKEVKSLLKDRYVLLAVIIAPFFSLLIIGSIYSIGFRQVVEEAREAQVSLPRDTAIVLEDPGDLIAKSIALILNANTVDSVGEALEHYRIIIVFHRGFSESLENGRRGNVSLIVKTSKPWSLSDTMITSSLTTLLSRVVETYLSQKFNISRELLSNPLNVNVKPYVNGREFSQAEAAFLTLAVMATVFAILILSMVTLQVGALSIGMEREARTAELLLALPASRAEIVFGKMVGAVTVSFAAFISFIAGGLVYYYALLPVMMSELGEGALQATTIFQVFNFIDIRIVSIILLALALHIINATLTGILVGVLFAGDIRGALTASSYIGLALIAPLIPEVTGFSVPPALEAIFTLTPYYPPYKLVESIILGHYMKAPLYLTIIIAYFAILTLLTSKLMSGERLIYGIAVRRLKPPI